MRKRTSKRKKPEKIAERLRDLLQVDEITVVYGIQDAERIGVEPPKRGRVLFCLVHDFGELGILRVRCPIAERVLFHKKEDFTPLILKTVIEVWKGELELFQSQAMENEWLNRSKASI